MSKTKTRDERENIIMILRNEIQAHSGVHCAAVDTLKSKLSQQLSAWFELIRDDINICVARNEQTPWTQEELGYPTRPMFKKAEFGMDQVGDYQIVINRMGPINDSFSSLLVERKGCTYDIDCRGCSTLVGCDLYSTLMTRSNHERFVREIDKYKLDTRFETLCVIVECSYNEFLRFRPPFNGQTWNNLNHGASRESRIGAVNSLIVKHGVQVLFAGNRMNAITAYRNMIRQSVICDYVRFIGR